MEVLGGEVDFDVDGFEMVLEPEFTLVLVKVKGLGGAGALSELIDLNSSFPVTVTPSMFFATLETFRKNIICRFSFTMTSTGTHAAMLLSDLMPKLNARRALVLEYIFEVLNIFLKFHIYVFEV